MGTPAKEEEEIRRWKEKVPERHVSYSSVDS